MSRLSYLLKELSYLLKEISNRLEYEPIRIFFYCLLIVGGTLLIPYVIFRYIPDWKDRSHVFFRKIPVVSGIAYGVFISLIDRGYWLTSFEMIFLFVCVILIGVLLLFTIGFVRRVSLKRYASQWIVISFFCLSISPIASWQIETWDHDRGKRWCERAFALSPKQEEPKGIGRRPYSVRYFYLDEDIVRCSVGLSNKLFYWQYDARRGEWYQTWAFC